MNDEEHGAAWVEMLSAEADRPYQVWWLSFADPGKPDGEQFLGCVIVAAQGFAGAVLSARMKEINPGGEVRGVPLPDDVVALVAPGDIDRLLTHDEAVALSDRLMSSRRQ